jgi:hypothetical protein
VLSFFVVLAVWAAFSWPLPRHVSHGIPWSAHRGQSDPVSVMTAGDHLQLLYHFWLASDMIRGKTPAFNNIYEFNTGDDAALRRVRPYYFPFCYVYHLFAQGGRAWAWNLTGFISIWGTFWLTWCLARRYASSEWIAMAAALVGVALPFRWISLLGGSPIGLSMVWAPMLMLGVDLAVRDARIFGGLMAGIAMLFMAWTDSHMFFFGALIAPAWCVVAWTQRAKDAGLWWRAARRAVVALLPLGLFLALALVLNKAFMSKATTTLLAGGGRSMADAMNTAPRAAGFFSFLGGNSDQVYLGWCVLLLVLMAAVVFSLRTAGVARSRQEEWGRWRVAFWLLVLGMLGMMVLALGPRGPKHGWIFEHMRAWIPPYTMIRQPAKIFCLAPTVLAVLVALSWSSVAQMARGRWFRLAIWAWVAVMLLEYRHGIRPAICLLDKEQTAYRVVAEDARERGVPPRAIVLPLWPGDSHWASLYEYYVSLYRIRMVNGYHPVVKPDYMDEVFLKLESANKGFLTGDQVRYLQQMGVDYVLFHENAFPEKVSPFPSGSTLARLLEHPQLDWLTQADGVWAFRIVPAEHRHSQEFGVAVPVLFPARSWEAESLITNRMAVAIMEDASREKAAALMAGESLRIPPVRLPADDGLRWLLRVRGEGELQARLYEDGAPGAVGGYLEVNDTAWRWLEVPAAMHSPYAALSADIAVVRGRVAVDMVILMGGAWHALAPGEVMEIPAAAFFHAGYTDSQSGAVVLRPQRDPSAVVFYGWRLPAEAGVYEVEVLFQTWASEGVKVGELVCGRKSEGETVLAELKPGGRALGRFTRANNLPFQVGVRYTGADTLEISAVRLTRLPDAEKTK